MRHSEPGPAKRPHRGQPSQDGEERDELAALLRAEAETVDTGRPPVEVVIRNGRSLRSRRHAVVAAAAVVAVAVPLGVTWLAGAGGGGAPAPSAAAPPSADAADPGPANVPGSEQESETDPETGSSPDDDPDARQGGAADGLVEVVAEGESVDVGHGLRLGLLAGTVPRYAVAPQAELAAALQDAPPPSPEPLSVRVVPAPDDNGVVVAGAVLDPSDPGEVRVTVDGQEYAARLLQFSADADWGVYAAELPAAPRDGQVRVSVLDHDGEVTVESVLGTPPAG